MVVKQVSFKKNTQKSDNLSLNKILKLHNLKILVWSVFQEDNKYYPHVFLEEFLYESQRLEYDRIYILKGIDLNKANTPKECDIFHCWYFLDKGCKYEPYL